MNRRSFIKNTGAAGLVSTVSTNILKTSGAAPFKLLYAPHFGMFENSAGKDLVDQVQFMYDEGFRALEDNGMMGRDIATQEAIGNRMAKLGMQMGVFVVNFDPWPPKTNLASGSMEWRKKFLDTCKEAVGVAKRVNAKYMTVVPGNFDRTLPMGIQMSNVIDSLRLGAEIFEPHNLTMVLEPLSDNPDLFMRYSDQTFLLCRAVNSPSCKILFDMWHMQRNEGRIMYNIDQTWSEIAYFQIGDEPGRKEPGTGEMNYKNLFQYINDRAAKEKKSFILGMEHGNKFPGKEGERKLIEAYRAADL
jgi:hydroxypyruvate isomerase